MNANDRKLRIKELETELDALKREHADEGRKCHPKPVYTFTSRLVTTSDTYSKIVTLAECIRVIATLTNPLDLKDHIQLYGTGNCWDDKKVSPIYYRLNGVLLHEGGGHLLLGDGILCSDEQWEGLKNGIVPKELLRNYFQ